MSKNDIFPSSLSQVSILDQGIKLFRSVQHYLWPSLSREEGIDKEDDDNTDEN